uniref:Omega-hydroxypalmitate O-feruloyl transferase n=1 Tax=Rhizophora mucronata TaxID=61149 RepID=A0A2P2MCJ0_RHIMU
MWVLFHDIYGRRQERKMGRNFKHHSTMMTLLSSSSGPIETERKEMYLHNSCKNCTPKVNHMLSSRWVLNPQSQFL